VLHYLVGLAGLEPVTKGLRVPVKYYLFVLIFITKYSYNNNITTFHYLFVLIDIPQF